MTFSSNNFLVFKLQPTLLFYRYSTGGPIFLPAAPDTASLRDAQNFTKRSMSSCLPRTRMESSARSIV